MDRLGVLGRGYVVRGTVHALSSFAAGAVDGSLALASCVHSSSSAAVKASVPQGPIQLVDVLFKRLAGLDAVYALPAGAGVEGEIVGVSAPADGDE
jgi:hypothetical protein